MATKAARKKAADAAVVEAPPVQIQELCFNTFGHAIRTPNEHQQVPLFLVARTPIMQTYTRVYNDVTEGQPKSRLALSLTKEEMGPEPSPTQERYLFVGWVLDNVEATTITKSARNDTKRTRKAPLGTVAPKDDAILEPGDALPLMAVVRTAIGEFDPAARSSLQTFVLLKQHAGLCTPYMVAQDRVFYLSAFRDETNDLKHRGKNWNDMVAKHAILSSENAPSVKRIQMSKGRDQTKFQVGPTASLKNEILTLSTSYELSNNIQFLQELEKVLEYADQDLKHVPVHNEHLRRFVDAVDEEGQDEELFTLQDAMNMVEEIKVCWPDVQVAPEKLYLIQRGMTFGRVVVEYRTLRPFLLESLYQLQREDIKKDDINAAARIAQEAINTIERISGYSNSPLALSEDQYQRMFRAIRGKLSEMISTNEEFVGMLKTAASDAALGVNFQDIWGTYAEALDTDTARKAFDEVVKLLVVAFRQVEATLASRVEELVRIMDEATIG
jgi:hypothetical protein